LKASITAVRVWAAILGSPHRKQRPPTIRWRIASGPTPTSSEALTFDATAAQECGFGLHPYVIFHPQLNVDPRHPDISSYRYQVFGRNVSKEIEVVTLNWARGFVLSGRPPSQYGGSAIYTKSPEFDSGDARLEANHQKGLYYTHSPRFLFVCSE